MCMTTLTDAGGFASTGHGEHERTGVVLSHGFTGSPTSMLAWARHLADRGYAVRLPLLPGHGTSWQELARTPWQRWYGEIVRAYEELRSMTDVQISAGLSMGGTLALRLAAHEDVAGVVVVNPGLTIGDPRARYAGLLRYVVPSMPAIANSIKKEGMDENAYSRTPVAAVHQLSKLFRATASDLSRITAPVLVFRSSVDPVVPESSMALLRERIGSAQMEVVPLSDSYHVATMDNDAPLIFSRTDEFLEKLRVGGS